MGTVFIYSIISLFIGGIMWSFEGSKFTDHGQNMSMLLFFKFSMYISALPSWYIVNDKNFPSGDHAGELICDEFSTATSLLPEAISCI